MVSKSFKSLLVAVFSLSLMFFFVQLSAHPQTNSTGPQTEKKTARKLDPAKIIMEHVSDAHEFHFFTFKGKKISIPLPVLLYSPTRGFSVFMSSAFKDGDAICEGYRLLEEKFMEENGLEGKKDAKGKPLYNI